MLREACGGEGGCGGRDEFAGQYFLVAHIESGGDQPPPPWRCRGSDESVCSA